MKNSWCLKITEKVSFNIASEASYVYILRGLKLIKDAKNGQFGEFLKIWCLRSNNGTRQVNMTKIGRKCHNRKIKCDILGGFQTVWTRVSKWNVNTYFFLFVLYTFSILLYGQRRVQMEAEKWEQFHFSDKYFLFWHGNSCSKRATQSLRNSYECHELWKCFVFEEA